MFGAGDPQETQRVLQTLMSNLPGMVYRCRNDRDWTLLFISNGCLELTGYSPDDYLSARILYGNVVHPDDREAVWNDVQKAVDRREPFQLIYRIVTAGGEEKWVWEQGRGIFDEAGKLLFLEGFVNSITPRVRAESERHAYHRLLEAIRLVQSQYIADAEPSTLFQELLDHFLEITQSAYGFIGEIHRDNGTPYLKAQAITDIAWDDKNRAFCDRHAPEGMAFRNLQSLFGAVITSGNPLIANDPEHDPHSGGLPAGHPALKTFLGIPLYHGERLIGMVGVANRLGGYTSDLVEYLQPLLITCANIIEAYRNSRKRKETELALRESEERYRLFIENASDMIQSVDRNGNFLFANRTWLETMGYAAEEAKGLNMRDIIHPDSRAHCFKIFERVMAGEAVNDIRAKFVAKGGRTILIEGSATPRKIENVVVASQGIYRDVTERQVLEREILATSEREQSRIGRDFHDGLGQHLTGIAFLSKVLEENMTALRAPGAADAARITALVNQAIHEAKNLAKGLSPIPPGAGGLAIALQSLAERTEGMFRIPCALSHQETSDIPSDAAIHLYRIAQEAIHNAAKHGAATLIEIRLERVGDETILSVRDNGQGFDPHDPATRNGMGLRIMSYRANMVGALLDIRRLPEGGMAVICSVPRKGTGKRTKPS